MNETKTALDWKRALQSLTPGGSEFTTPAECERYVRTRDSERWELLKKTKRDRDALAARLAAAEARVGRMQEALEEFSTEEPVGVAAFWLPAFEKARAALAAENG